MELTSPITIYWDLPPEPADPERLRRICADIAACRPLMLQLTVSSPDLGEETVAVLEAFRGGPIAVTPTVPLPAFDAAAAVRLRDLQVKEVLLAVESVDLLREGRGAFRPSPAAAPAIGISFPVTRDTWRELPAVIAFCREEGVNRLVFPMQRLYGGESPFFITRAEQGELAEALSAGGGAAGLNLTIHDPFLWRAFNPGVPFPQGGCQAANTMIAIAPDGGVYPCPTLPVRLGAIREMLLKEIIASAAKKEFRQQLLQCPDACLGCAEVTVCKGGCRGRAYVMHQSLEGDDPACW